MSFSDPTPDWVVLFRTPRNTTVEILCLEVGGSEGGVGRQNLFRWNSDSRSFWDLVYVEVRVARVPLHYPTF